MAESATVGFMILLNKLATTRLLCQWNIYCGINTVLCKLFMMSDMFSISDQLGATLSSEDVIKSTYEKHDLVY